MACTLAARSLGAGLTSTVTPSPGFTVIGVPPPLVIVTDGDVVTIAAVEENVPWETYAWAFATCCTSKAIVPVRALLAAVAVTEVDDDTALRADHVSGSVSLA